MSLIIIMLIVIVILALAIWVMYLVYNKKIGYYKIVSSNLDSMNVVQKMFELTTSSVTADEKILALNSIIIEAYGAKYSTISLFDGNCYELRASNVEKSYKESVANIAEENDFKANAVKNVSKYLTTDITKTLSYKSAVERNIRSAMFSPIYYTNMYLGFWLLEDESDNAFDTISKNELAKIKANMGIFLENINFQKTIEIAENTDKQTGFYNNMYLYSNTRNELNKFENSVFTLICLKNMPDINEEFGRNIGNALLIKVSNALKDILSSDSIFVRYSGIRLLIITPGITSEVLHPIIERALSRLKGEVEYVKDKKVSITSQILMHTFKKQNNIERELQKMVSYIDKMEEIDTIKII
ncbi:MAG: diguanylate cyclase [Clostridia bacterium]